MYSFRRIALSLALVTLAVPALQAQSSSSNPPTQAQPAATTQQLSVQARIRARREQRRSNAIHEAYSHRYEAYTGVGYLRFTPGPDRQRTTLYAWDTGLTRYYNDRLGVTVDGRGYYGTAFVGLNTYGITRPAISQYDALVGPTYRFYLQPKYSISARVMGGFAHGNFSGDTNGLGGTTLKLYPDANTFAASASVSAEYSLTPAVAFRLSPEYFATGFGSTTQLSRGFTGSIVYRFGKQ
jgi:hypothetical protein